MPENKINEDSNKDKLIENLRAEIASYKKSKKFGLVFEEKGEKIVDKISSHVPYLSLRADKSFIVNRDAPTHELIKGDNYAALLTLLPEYRGKVDVIYIDPPYNTGNNDFIYNDRYVDKEDGYRHSTWLSFMKRRLNLAKELLSENGVIFVSIDDNEQAHLKILMDEIFGAENFVASSIRKNVGSVTTKSDSELQKLHDYVIVYKQKETTFRKVVSGKKTYPYSDDNGDYYLVPLQDNGPNGTKSARPNLWYPIYVDENNNLFIEEENRTSPAVETVLPKDHKHQPGCWMWSKKKFLNDKNDLTIHNGKPHIKHYYKEGDDTNKYQRQKSWLDDHSNRNGSNEVKDVLGPQIFSYPKPVSLIKWAVGLHPSKSATVLDFFAGSGTTGHAVAELNAEDGGTRKCILVTDSGKSGNAENSDMSDEVEDGVDIAEDITYERMRRVLTGEDWANPDKAIALNQNFVMRDVKFVSCKETIQTIDENFEEIEEITDLYKSDIISRIIEDEGLEDDNNTKETLVDLLGEDYLYYDEKKANTLYNYWLTTKEQTKGGK